MYTTSTDFKTVINNPSRKFECKVVCGSKTYTNVNIANINITGSLQPSGYTIGSAISQKATFKFINDGNVTFPSNTISLQIGLLVNGSYEYIPIGSYTVDSHDSDDYTITIIAYDNMVKFESKYNGVATTLRALAQEVCGACDVTLADSGSIPTTTITTPTSGKYTCRELMGYIAGCCCGNAVIDRNGALKVQKLKLSTINKQVTTDNWFTYKNADMIFQIEQLICDTGSNEKLTSGSTTDTDKQLTIKNPLMTQSILDSVKTELSGVIFTGFDIKYQGDISTDLGDTVKITDRKGQMLTAPLLNRTINYNGGLTENIKTEGKKKVDVASSYYSSGRYALELDKFNFNMKDFNSQLGDFKVELSGISDIVAKLEPLNYFLYAIYVPNNNNTVVVDMGSDIVTLTVDWGDGSTSKNSESTSQGLEHVYINSGVYTIKIVSSDVMHCVDVAGAGITKVLKLPDGLMYMSNSFTNNTLLTECCDLPNTVKDCGFAFKGCTALVRPPKLSTSLSDAQYMFYGCTSLTSMASFDGLGNVDCTGMYEKCTSLVECEPINDSITICDRMFYGCTNLVIPSALGESVTSANLMFMYCSKLIQTPVFTDSLVNCEGMFSECTSLVSVYPLKEKVINAESMFYNCTSLVKAPYLPEGVVNCKNMFSSCSKLEIAPHIPDGATDCESMFQNCIKITKVSSFPSGLVNALRMFGGCTELVEVPNVLPQSVRNACGMFGRCTKLTITVVINSAIEKCEGMFAHTAITSIPPENVQLMIDVKNGTNTTCWLYGGCYMGCTKITSPDTYNNYYNGIYSNWFK